MCVFVSYRYQLNLFLYLSNAYVWINIYFIYFVQNIKLYIFNEYKLYAKDQ